MRVWVTKTESESDDEGLKVAVTIRRLRDQLIVRSAPTPDDQPEDIVLGILEWLLSTQRGRKLVQQSMRDWHARQPKCDLRADL